VLTFWELISLQQILGELPPSNWKTKDPYIYSEPGSGVSIVYATTPGRLIPLLIFCLMYQGADKSLAQPGRKQAWKHVRDAHDFNNIKTWAVIKFFFLQGKAPKEIHAILTEILACFLPCQAKDLSAPLHVVLLEVHLALMDLYTNKAASMQVELQHNALRNTQPQLLHFQQQQLFSAYYWQIR